MFPIIAAMTLLFGTIGGAKTNGLGVEKTATEYTGVLIDKECSYSVEPRVVPGPRIEGGMISAYVHKRDCALQPDRQRSGYGVFTYDQVFVPFDAEGNKKALAFLRSTKKEDDLRVIVKGQMESGSLKVQEIRWME